MPIIIVAINKIEITGNAITKNETIRSKILIEPGQYLNQYTLENSIKNLQRYPYVNKGNTETNINNQLADIIIDIDEDEEEYRIAGIKFSDLQAELRRAEKVEEEYNSKKT